MYEHKWSSAAACGMSFYICSVALTTHHFDIPLAHAFRNQSIETKNYTLI
jgi:hypothetical protein